VRRARPDQARGRPAHAPRSRLPVLPGIEPGAAPRRCCSWTWTRTAVPTRSENHMASAEDGSRPRPAAAHCRCPQGLTRAAAEEVRRSPADRLRQAAFVWSGGAGCPRQDHGAGVRHRHKRHPKITIHGQFLPWGDYFNKLSTLIAAGSMPDIVQLNTTNLAAYAKKGPPSPRRSPPRARASGSAPSSCDPTPRSHARGAGRAGRCCSSSGPTPSCVFVVGREL
jgi:hypothetical protein